MMHVDLPWELVEDILYRVPPLSLIRFKIVCKKWNTLFNNKTFINNHLALIRPQFLIWTGSKMNSVCVNLNDDPKIEMRELPLEIPYLHNYYMRNNLITCDGLIFCASSSWKNRAAIWNPWLRRTRWIESEEERFDFRGIGYDSGRSEKDHKIIGISFCERYKRLGIYKLETNEWKYINVLPGPQARTDKTVCLNGNMYWAARNLETDEDIIQSFNCSKEITTIFCVLRKENNSFGLPVLSAFRGDKLSVLYRFIRTNDIEIWVTKNKIIEDVENVAWMKFMTVSIPFFVGDAPSYFIDNIYRKTLVMCCEDENKNLCIYIVRANASTKIQLRVDFKDFIMHRFYVPSLVPVP